jgi:hypothetical protein
MRTPSISLPALFLLQQHQELSYCPCTLTSRNKNSKNLERLAKQTWMLQYNKRVRSQLF